ncbi:MAG: hypothetical protein FJZ01_14305 [Candidatus Sericytochromatia bacterium]|nr:hypothetical protein [Candidatus Tanganyikabacteria bacterium]
MVRRTLVVQGWLPLLLVLAGCAAVIPASAPMVGAGGTGGAERAATTVRAAEAVPAMMPMDGGHMMSADQTMMKDADHAAMMAPGSANCPLRKAQALGEPAKRCPLSGRSLTP